MWLVFVPRQLILPFWKSPSLMSSCNKKIYNYSVNFVGDYFFLYFLTWALWLPFGCIINLIWLHHQEQNLLWATTTCYWFQLISLSLAPKKESLYKYKHLLHDNARPHISKPFSGRNRKMERLTDYIKRWIVFLMENSIPARKMRLSDP